MQTLPAYLFRQATGPLLAVLGALAGISLLTQGLNQLDIIVTNRQSALTYAWVTMLATPQLIALVLPLAMFFAAAFAGNRLRQDNETVVMMASGMSAFRIARPILQLAMLAALAHLAVNVIVQPAANRAMRTAVHDIRSDVAASMVREGAFTFPADNLAIYARDRGAGGELRDLMVHDTRGSRPTTYTARSGVVAMVEGRPSIVMRNGQVQAQRPDGSLQVLDFFQYVFQLDALVDASGEVLLKPSDRYLLELFYPDFTHHYDQRNVGRLLAEAHHRLSSPLLNPALALVALAFALGGDLRRGGYGQRLLIAGVIAFGVRLFALGIQAAAVREPALNAVQYAFPLVVCVLAAFVLLGHRPGRARRAAP